MKNLRGKTLFVTLSLVFTMMTGLISFSAAAEVPALSPTSLDISASNWDLVQGFTNATDNAKAVDFTGETAYENGVVYKNNVDVSKEVAFDIKFTDQQLANGDGWFAVTLGVDNHSFNDAKKGITYIFGKKTDAAVEMFAQNPGPWWDLPFSEVNSMKIVKGETSWDLYIKNSKLTSFTLAASIPFETVPESTFTDSKAKLGIYVYDKAVKPIKFEISNLTHIVNTAAPILYPKNTYVLPANNDYYSGNDSVSYSAGVFTLNKGAIGYYSGSKLVNVMAQFKMTASITGSDWVAFILKQDAIGRPLWDQTNCYYILINKDGVASLTKRLKGNPTDLASGTIANFSNIMTTQNTVRVGAIDENKAVRIILDVNGVNVINYLDSNPVTQSGKMGFETYGDATAKIYAGPAGVDSNDSGVADKLGDSYSYVGGNIVNTGAFIERPNVVNGTDLSALPDDAVIPEKVDPTYIDSNNVKIDIANAEVNQDILEDVTQTPNLEKSIFADLQKPDNVSKTLSLVSYDIYGDIMYKWTFKGSSIDTLENFKSSVVFSNNYSSKIEKLANGYKPFYITCDQKGVLPGEAEFTVKINQNWAKGKKTDNLYIYSYDQTRNTLKLVSANVSADEYGYAKFNTKQAGYFLVTDKLLDNISSNPKTSDNISSNPKTSDNLNLYILFAIVSALLLIAAGKKRVSAK